jgi:IS5 family transposase
LTQNPGKSMPHKSAQKQSQMEMFKHELEALVDPTHPLVKLGKTIDWTAFEKALGATYHAGIGAPGVNTRLMVALHYLKYQHDLSDETVVAAWVENIHWQHFSGEQFLQHQMPIAPSSMTRWRQRLGETGAELMLKQTIDTAIKLKALAPAQLRHINIDTTVQTKAIRYPTDARLHNRARERLVKLAREHGKKIKQSYKRVGAVLLKQVGRYAHARQMKRAAACTRKLRTNLGRIIREIERQKPGQKGKLANMLAIAKRIHAQQPQDKHKVHSVHEPHVSCIAKGKAGKKYEFGSKASIASTSKGVWIVGAQNKPGNPYDGHTLTEQIKQVRRLVGKNPATVHVDMGYRGHNHEGPETIHVDKRRRGTISKSLWRWMKRRSAVEPMIGHCKSEHRMERNRLKGEQGDAINAVLSATAMNFQKLLIVFWRYILMLLLGSDKTPQPVATSCR